MQDCKGKQLLVLDHANDAALYGDPQKWLHAIQYLETHWFAPMLDALQNGLIETVEIISCVGSSIFLFFFECIG